MEISDNGDTILARPELFLEIMPLATETLRHFQPSEWHLCIARTGQAITKVMKDIKLTA